MLSRPYFKRLFSNELNTKGLFNFAARILPMNVVNESLAARPPRLKFIDMARSIAILMMLEGHFTGAALAMEYRSDAYPLYTIWHIIHGLTTPLFFTVTGLIFVYLLLGKQEVSFLGNIRIKKGFRRVGQLLFWGYFIQLNLWSIGKSLINGTKFQLDWLFAFHVLQSIGVGILLVILIYGVFSMVKRGNIMWYYLGFSFILFIFYGLLKNYMEADLEALNIAAAEGLKLSPKYWPEHAHPIFQNMFYGKYSDFSFVRMSVYTLLGAALGAMIRTYEHHVKKWWFGLSLILAGILISVFALNIMSTADWILHSTGLVPPRTMHPGYIPLSRFGQVVVLIGILNVIDTFFTVKLPLFLKLGQNTFAIYVIHAIILYNGIFGLGLQPHVFDRNLHPMVAVCISLSAILFFTLMVKYIEPLEKFYYNALHFLKLRKRKAPDQ
jgi:hypothetical protein